MPHAPAETAEPAAVSAEPAAASSADSGLRSAAASGVTEFIGGLAWTDVPESPRRQIVALLRDFTAVTCAGSSALTSRLAADYAVEQLAGDQATLLHDGRRASATGAAWANGVLANALDFDDGHRLVKGHPGAIVIPAALAVAETVGAARADVLAAITVGYEVAVRAGIAQHARNADYHGSGSWGAIGAAAAGARLLRLDPDQIGHALGLAEYHAPMAPIMRSVADPAMTKDGCGWGAMTGTSSALMAATGFTATRGVVLDDLSAEPAGPSRAALGQHWYVEDMYIKAFPCCRWSQPAIAAALAVRDTYGIEPETITDVSVRSFAAAAALSRRPPTTTEQAQYNVVWPVACALLFGEFSVTHVHPPSFADQRIHALAARIRMQIDPTIDADFPAVRRAVVSVRTADGGSFSSDLTGAPGDPEDPAWADLVEQKFARHAAQLPDWSPLAALLD